MVLSSYTGMVYDTAIPAREVIDVFTSDEPDGLRTTLGAPDPIYILSVAVALFGAAVL